MTLNFLRSVFRNFRRHIGYTMLSLASLSLGLGCSVLMLLFAWHEFGYDEFHAKKDRLYRMVTAVDGSSCRAGGSKEYAPLRLRSGQVGRREKDYLGL